VAGELEQGGHVRRTLVAAIAVVVLASLTVTGVASAKPAGKTITVTLAGITFNGKANNTAKAKVGDKLKFVWKNGDHNVLSSAVPKGVKKVNSGAVTAKRAPLLVSLTKKGTYAFYCAPHAALGMKIKVAVS
jgi:plastocyanin